MLRTESSSRSNYKKRIILLFGSSMLQIDRRFVEEFFNCEPRRINNDHSQRPNKATEMIQKQLTTHQRNSTRTRQLEEEKPRFRGTRTLLYAY